ncbi:GAF domain-containing protein [Epibacterium ulvae]|uniref:GAF domain-containing protein n=1 Tax=Epibacterium ulvae TaxID=1156985 RepID=UPI001BFCD198|nr:GAF domain-containing protein [Epibacterium ulvae]MBT8152311.1 GAF domain-containing protein [Epibacterium ulvae]
MGVSAQSEHAKRVLKAAGSPMGAAKSRVIASWRRSIERHGLDPAELKRADRIDTGELRHRRSAADRFRAIAAPQLDQLYRLVGQSGCSVLLTDAEGVVLEQRCSDGDAHAFRAWGLWEGANWSEQAEGTNGIGTCLTEERALIVHRHEHFFARNAGMSCIDAPIFGADGQIIGALDVSSARVNQTEGINQLIAASVLQTARQIEAEAFRAAFPKARFVLADAEEGPLVKLLAVNSDDIVIGATRGARRKFGLAAMGPIELRPASDLLGRHDNEATGFERGERAAVMRALARADGNVSQAARALGVGRATLYRRMKRLGIGESAE